MHDVEILYTALNGTKYMYMYDMIRLWNTCRNILYFSDSPALDVLFAEELGLVLEVSESHSQEVVQEYSAQNVRCHVIGHSQEASPTDAKVQGLLETLIWIVMCQFSVLQL